MVNNYYTGIGSRKTPRNIMEQMIIIAQFAQKRGLILRSGGAEGADTAFENGAGNLKEIYLPWKDFNDNKSLLFNNFSNKACQLASSVHPKWMTLKTGAKKLHARNVHQVFGKDLQTPSDFLVCWTEDGKTIGGTATAIRLAEGINIPVFNLGIPNIFNETIEFIGHNYEIGNSI